MECIFIHRVTYEYVFAKVPPVMMETFSLNIIYKGVIIMTKTLYGIVQEASQLFIKHFKMILDILGYKHRNPYPCLMYISNKVVRLV